MEPTTKNVSRRQANETFRNTQPDSDALAARDQQDKAVKTLQARAATAGYALHLVSDGKAGSQFLLCRWNLSRTLADAVEVDALLTRMGVPA